MPRCTLQRTAILQKEEYEGSQDAEFELRDEEDIPTLDSAITPHTSKLLLCVTRTRVPYIASTTLVHRNIVNIVISNAYSLLSTLFSHKTQRSNQHYSLIRFDQDGLSQIRAKPRHSRQNLCHKIRLRRPQKGRSKT
jgi:hypothetical protein